MVAQKCAAPFGASVERFGRITVHPNLDRNGQYTKRPDACDPCYYHPIPIHKIFEVNKNLVGRGPWRNKKDLEDWAQNLGYRNSKVLKERRYWQSVLGPAWHDVHTPRRYEPACKNVLFGRTPRMRPTSSPYPGPGTYYNAHPYKAPHGPHSTRPTLEREEPCRFKDPVRNWSLAPNRYNIIDKDSIGEKPNKIVSLRGPYDLFTGERFKTRQRLMAATWPIALKGTLDKYDKSHFGKMNKTNRSKPYRGRLALVNAPMCHRRPEDPGPAHYSLPLRKIEPNKRPFNSSYDKEPGYQRTVVWPGVGRYSPNKPSCGAPGHGWTYVFKSKQKRTIGAIIQEPMNTF